MVSLKRGLVYYTSNRCQERIVRVVRNLLTKACPDYEIVSVSQYPIDWGRNIVVPLQNRNVGSQLKQMLIGIENSKSDIIFLAEDDILYHPNHFDFTPKDKNVFYYDRNRWAVYTKTGEAVTFKCDAISMLCAYRELLLEHYTKRVELIERKGFIRRLGFSPPRGLYGPERMGLKGRYKTKHPCIDIRHENSMTRIRMNLSDFRRKPRGWKKDDNVPGWGKTLGRFDEFLLEISKHI